MPVSPDAGAGSPRVTLRQRSFVPEFVKFERADLESRDYSRDYSSDMSEGSDDVMASNDGEYSLEDIEHSLAETKLDARGKRFVQLQTPAAVAAAEKERKLAE